MSITLAEYVCADCGRFEAFVDRPAPDQHDCPICDELADWVISAPKPKVWTVPCYAAVRGGDSERRPGMLDTRPLAEGQPLREWKANQAKKRISRRHDQLVAKGIKKKRIQVG